MGIGYGMFEEESLEQIGGRKEEGEGRGWSKETFFLRERGR